MKRYCEKCHEDSMIVKIEVRISDGKMCRNLICMNIGCGRVIPLPFPEDVKIKLC